MMFYFIRAITLDVFRTMNVTSKDCMVLLSTILTLWYSQISGAVHTRNKSLWDWLRNVNLWNDLDFSLYAMLSVCCMITISDKRKKSEMKVSTEWCITVEYQRSSSIRIIFVNYQTSELQCNYQSYIQRDNIGDTWDFSGKTLIRVWLYYKRPSQMEVFPLQKMKYLDSCITTMWMCCKKGSCCGRQACIVDVGKAVLPQKYIFQIGRLGI